MDPANYPSGLLDLFNPLRLTHQPMAAADDSRDLKSVDGRPDMEAQIGAIGVLKTGADQIRDCYEKPQSSDQLLGLFALLCRRKPHIAELAVSHRLRNRLRAVPNERRFRQCWGPSGHPFAPADRRDLVGPAVTTTPRSHPWTTSQDVCRVAASYAAFPLPAASIIAR